MMGLLAKSASGSTLAPSGGMVLTMTLIFESPSRDVIACAPNSAASVSARLAVRL